MVADRTIEILHDRSKAPTLKEFSSNNYEVAAHGHRELAAGGSDFDWKSLFNRIEQGITL